MICQSTSEQNLVDQTSNYFATLAVPIVGSKVQVTRPKLLAAAESCTKSIVFANTKNFKKQNITLIHGN